MLITWLLLHRRQGERRAPTTSWWSSSCSCSGCSSCVGAMHIDPANYMPFAPERLARHPPGRGDRVLRLHRLRRDLDRGRGDARTRSATCRSASSAASPSARSSTSSSASWRPGWCRISSCKAADPLARALRGGRAADGQLDRGVRRGRVADRGAAGVPVRPAAHLLRDGARRPAARRGPRRSTRSTARRTSRRSSPGIVVALGALVADENEIYDLTNIGTLSAFAIVCIGVLVLRVHEPERPRPFRVPFVWPVVARRRGRLPLHHDGPADACVGALRHLARRRARCSTSSTATGTAGCDSLSAGLSLSGAVPASRAELMPCGRSAC